MAMALATSASAQGLADTPPTPGLEKAGWTLVTASDSTWVYMRAAASAATTWWRHGRATPWAAAEPNSVGAVRMAFACRTLVET